MTPHQTLLKVGGLSRARREADGAGRKNGEFAVLLHRLLRDGGVMRAILGVSPRDLAVDIKGIANRIVAADFYFDMAQEAAVAGPVREMMGHPGAALRTVVVSGGGTDESCEIVLPMDTLWNIGDAELIGDAETGMLLQLLPGKFVGANIKTAPDLRERDEPGDGHGAFDHGLELVADLDVFDITRSCAADFLTFVESKDFREVLAGILDRGPLLGLSVLGAALARGIALGAETPAIALGHQFAALIEELATVNLLNRAAGEARVVLDQILEPDFGGKFVTEKHRAMPDNVDTGEHRMAPSEAADIATK